MKLLIASDVHGSAYYCKLLEETFRRTGAEKLLLLGDLLYHGARNALPREYDTVACAKILNGLKENVLCVRGNCDSEVDQMVLEFPIMAESALVWLGRPVYATHGHKTPACLSDGDVLLNGHFHVPAFERRENYWYVNCGSVSIPKENSPHSCILADGGNLQWIDLETGEVFLNATLS